MKGNSKKTIAVVILAALTLAAFSILSSPSVRAAASEAKILSYTWYVAPSNTVLAESPGDLVAVGELQNVGSNVIKSVFIIGVAYNSSGGILDSNGNYAFVYDVLPGEKAPFYIDFIPGNSVTHSQSWVTSVSDVTVEVANVIDNNATQYPDLISSAVTSSDSTGTYTVTGTVQNVGSETSGDVWVDTTFYNASGSVVSLNYTDYLSSALAPGKSVPFTATPTDNTVHLSSEIANYSLLIQSTLPTASASPSPSPSSSPLSSPVLIYAVVGVVVIVVVAVTTLAFLRKRRNLPPPPPPPPPPPSG